MSPLRYVSFLHWVGMTKTTHASRAFDAETYREIDRIMAGLISECKAPGLAYGIFDHAGLIHAGGMGVRSVATGPDASDAQMPRANTQFRIASMSKSFAAAAVMKLVWQGKVDLHAPASYYVPQLNGLTPFGNDAMPITVHHLLAMSSGLATDDAWADRQESSTRAQVQALLAQHLHANFAPGERYEYSNVGWAAIGELIHNVTGMCCADYVRRAFFAPLGLDDTTYDWHDMDPARTAMGYSLAEDGSWQTDLWADPGAFSVIGGVISTVTDMARWCAWLADAFPASPHGNTDPNDPAGDAILPRRYRRLMQMAYTPIPPVLRSGSSRGWITHRDFTEIEAYAYGLIVEHNARFGDVVYHSGGYPGYGSNMRWHLDSGLGVVVLTNGRYATPSVAAIRALGVLLEQRQAVGWTFSLRPETKAAMARVNALLARAAAAERTAEPTAARPSEPSSGVLTAAIERELLAMNDEGLLSTNVPMDEAFDRRARVLTRLLDATGLPVAEANHAGPTSDAGASAAAITTTGELTAETPAHAVWIVRCADRPLRCEIRLNALEHPQIQTLEFSLADTPRTDDIVTVTPATRIIG